ncbi:hypothetical protein IKD48_03065 [bacterium]|nr:hypothetical protein [bacterium]
MNVDLAGDVRTKASATLLRNVSIAKIHATLVGMFVDRLELQDVLLKETKQQWIDNSLNLDNEYFKQENCFLMHDNWNEFKRLAKKYNWQDLFVEDEKGGNNAW